MKKYLYLVLCLLLTINLYSAQTTKNDSIITREQEIQEVVMIGYGSQKKENVTGSISVISSEDISEKPNHNPISSIQGRVAGVNIQNSGSPGTSPRIDIRGISSLSGKTVFIVDGMITDDITFLNPQDIESMSILKDPSSLAIFGAKATNGAVIIKTKSGKNKTVFNFSTYIGTKVLTNIPKMANADQYIELYNEKLINDGGKSKDKISKENYSANTDWLDEIFKKSMVSSTDFSASGKTLKRRITYFTSIGYLRDIGNLNAGKGVNSGNNFNRLNTRLNFTLKIDQNISIGNNLSYSFIRTNNVLNPLLNAIEAPPIYYPIDPDTGTYQPITIVSVANPRASLDLFRGKNMQHRVLNNSWIETKFLKDFSMKISYTHDNTKQDSYSYNAVIDYIPGKPPTQSKLVLRDSKNENYVWDNILSWKKKFDLHNLEVLAGFSRSQNYHREFYESVKNVKYTGKDKDLTTNNGEDREFYTFNTGLGVIPYKNRIQSYFGRANYDYSGKYLVNASLRRDGATGFSRKNRYKVFPAISTGWVISKEDFMDEQNIFRLLKIRASWGKLGNPDVNRAYDKLTSVIESGTYFGGVGYPAETITKIVDTDIDWETTTGKEIGLEIDLRNNLKIEASYFNKDSKNIVYAINQSVISGASNWNDYVTNAYSFNNKGFEGSINYSINFTGNRKLEIFGNITTLKNKITEVAYDSYKSAGNAIFGNPLIRLEAGHPVGSYYGYKVVGVFQNQDEIDNHSKQNGARVGGFKFADIDENGIINEDDKTFLGSPIPKFSYGFGFNLKLSNFDFSMDFQGVYGNKIYNYNREERFGNENWDLDFYKNRWTGEGTSSKYHMATNNQSIILPSSFFVEDGSFFRLRNIQFGYTTYLRDSGAKIRFYTNAQNPITIFRYTGFSPEIMNGDRVSMGIDNNIHPISSIYTVGINLTF